jgi:hypothetical protein
MGHDHLWAGAPAPPPPPRAEPPPPPPPPQNDNFKLFAIALGLIAVGAIVGALASSSGDERPRVASGTAERPATTTAPTVTATTPTTTVPSPPLDPRHIVHRGAVGAPVPQYDDGILFTVQGIRQVSSIPHTPLGDPIEESPTRKLLRADITYVNRTKSNVDVFCGGYGARLADSSGRRIAPLHNYIDIKGNDDVCSGNKVAPNETSHVTLGFKLPRGRGVRGIYLFNAKAADFDGADTKIFFALR